METGKPLISVLMAVYEPQLDWLREQLESLNAQTYPNLRLYVRDDCSPTVPFADIERLVGECITAFPWSIRRNEENLGSNRTFERLTEEAQGDYFAYCDQDDVWVPEKLSTLEEQIGTAGLICSDVIPIDAVGGQLAKGITELRPRHIFHAGPGLSDSFLYKNFVIGCTMLIRSEIAKAALPFAENIVHDHYLAWYCALEHEIAVADHPLVRYRLHGSNQTGVLAHIATKEDYINLHLNGFLRRVGELSQRAQTPGLKDALAWGQARQDNALRKRGAVRRLWSLRTQNPSTTLFEIVALRLPNPLFRLAVRVIRSGKI